MNKVILIGNMGKTPETRTFDGGTKVSEFSIATTEFYKDKSGNKQESTEWHSVKCFGKLAEVLEKYGEKGQKVVIEGKIKTRDYTDKEGVKKYITEVIAESFTILSKKEG